MADASTLPPLRPRIGLLVGEPFRYGALVRNLVLKDLKLKYRGSALGVAWSLLNPILLLSVYTVAFKYIVRIQTEHYAYFLLVGLLPWTFFATAAQASTAAITGNGHLIRKVYFPRQILPMATVLFSFAQFLLALTVFLPLLILLSGAPVRWAPMAALPLLLAVHLAFTIGLAFALSSLTVFFRDIAHFTEVGILLLFWVTPIIYPVNMVPPALRSLFLASPPAAFAVAYQDLLFWGRMPDGLVIATILGWSLLAVVAGHAIFKRLSPRFAEEV
jgi:ABC-type polysaccharide/polyol phosphate export permease